MPDTRSARGREGAGATATEPIACSAAPPGARSLIRPAAREVAAGGARRGVRRGAGGGGDGDWGDPLDQGGGGESSVPRGGTIQDRRDHDLGIARRQEPDERRDVLALEVSDAVLRGD